MHACLTNSHVASSSRTSYDARFFYVNKQLGGYTCGFARNAMVTFLRNNGSNGDFLGTFWYSSLDLHRKNPSTLKFIVEQIILSSIIAHGFTIDGTVYRDIQQKSIINFPTTSSPFILPGYRPVMYIPEKWNVSYIDGILVHRNDSEKTAVVVPIQVTIAGRCRESNASFYSTWNEWESQLGLEGYKVRHYFLWVGKKEQAAKLVARATQTLGARVVLINPEYEIVHKTVASVDSRLGQKLAEFDEMDD